MSAVRENSCPLKGRFGEELRKVALEPECRNGISTVSIPALSPLADKLPGFHPDTGWMETRKMSDKRRWYRV